MKAYQIVDAQIEQHIKEWTELIDKIKPTKKDFGIFVVVSGDWLIRNNLAELWYNVRGIGLWSWTPAGIVDGKITERFQDLISLDQAKLLGFIGDCGGGGC